MWSSLRAFPGRTGSFNWPCCKVLVSLPNRRFWRWASGMNDFKGRHHKGEIILWAVRWYCKYGISYRDLETMMAERGVDVDHSTIYRWVQRYAPEIEKRLRWYSVLSTDVSGQIQRECLYCMLNLSGVRSVERQPCVRAQ